MNGIQLSPRFLKIHRVLEIPETAWQHWGSPPGDTYTRTQILGFLYEPPGGWDDPPGGTNCMLRFFFWFLVFHCCDDVWIEFYCTYIIGKLNYD